MKIWLLVVILTSPLGAEWQRKGYSAKGDWKDTAHPHPLSYFTQNPFLLDDANDFASTPEEKAALPLKMKARAEVRRFGVLGGFTVFDVLYFFEDKEAPDWNFVLVKTGTDEYREIVHIQRTQNDQYVGPSQIVTCGKEQILDKRAHAGGNMGVLYGDYFGLGKDGPVILDVDGPILKAAEGAIPKGKHIYGVVQADFAALKATVPLQSWNERCCSGSVEVKFRCDRNRIIATNAKYMGPE